MPECDSGKKEGMPVDMRTAIGKDKKLECETVRIFCGTCETVHEYIRSDSPQFKEKYAKREDLVEEIRPCGLTVEQVIDDYADDLIEVVTMDWLLDRIRTHRKED